MMNELILKISGSYHNGWQIYYILPHVDIYVDVHDILDYIQRNIYAVHVDAHYDNYDRWVDSENVTSYKNS